jgi:hypothetical protein
MKTPPSLSLGGVDSVDTATNRANAYLHIAPHSLPKSTESVSATIEAGQKLDRRTVFQLSGRQAGCPLLPAPNGDERVPQVREPEGKVGSSCP